ncbi:hypothetical protein [Endozoicomonas sp. 4G]|uniref:hypothetical protein n=1 Tax=Endozoicomonas sp. 4G TaxID=2872754 RepID=UPI002078CABE|nr:hypothetical protein [Endozoicomonas sp. 4G]
MVFCAPKGSSAEKVAEMGIAKFDYKLNPVEAAAIVQEKISDYPLLPNVVCTGEPSKIIDKANIGKTLSTNDNDLETVQKIKDAFAKTETKSNRFRRGIYEFTYHTIPPEMTKEIFGSSAEAKEQTGSGLSSGGISDCLSKNTGTLLLLPPMAFAAIGASEYTIYYVMVLALGVSFHQTGIWNSLTILTLNTAGIIAQAGLLYQQNKGAEFEDTWDTGGYNLDAVKEEYHKLRTAKADHETLPTTSWAVLNQQVAITALTFNSIKVAAAKYIGLSTSNALGVSFGQAAFNILFEGLTGSPLEDHIPIFKYNKKYGAANVRNWPYYGKRFVVSNFLIISWAVKQTGLIASQTAWAGKHLTKAVSFFWRKNKKD